jgi:Holliday junction resolvase
MGKMSRDKGARCEREIVALHKEIGVYAEKVPLSGGTRYQGNSTDVDIYPRGKDEAPLCSEVKGRANGEGFKTLEKWMGEADILFLRRDRSAPIVILPWTTYAKLVTGFKLPALPPSSSGE